MMEDLWPSGQPGPEPFRSTEMALCALCRRPTRSKTGECGHPVCAVCDRCPPCDGPLEAA